MPNILLVEDDVEIAEALKFRVEFEGFNCKWKTTGVEALDYFNDDINLIILDIGLPDISGFDVLRNIRKISDVPVIILTARSDSDDQVLGLEGLEADSYIIKKSGSDSPRVIIAQIKSLLRRSSTSTAIDKQKSIKDFVFNEPMKQILFKDKVLDLTVAECKILAHLIKNPSHVFERSALLNVMHDRPTGADETTINTHIKSIRRKIEAIDAGAKDRYIKTHTGIGYSFNQ